MKQALKYGLLITTLSLNVIASTSFAKNVSVQQFLQIQQPHIIIGVRTATTLENLGYTTVYNGRNYQKLKIAQPIITS